MSKTVVGVRCSKCGEADIENFYKGRYSWCKVCIRENQLVYQRRKRSTPEGKLDQARRQRQAHLKHRYGITAEQYAEMFSRQGGRCAICKVEVDFESRKGKMLVVDHDHETGKIRGLLCDRCNVALGSAEAIGIDKIISYISKDIEEI